MNDNKWAAACLGAAIVIVILGSILDFLQIAITIAVLAFAAAGYFWYRAAAKKQRDSAASME